MSRRAAGADRAPVFGICYGFQAMAQALGGTVAKTG
ncbi:gamma-glutamyl-gamma-aminobutyrate hydrolase family protein, partial [Micromonospora taraxaci]